MRGSILDLGLAPRGTHSWKLPVHLKERLSLEGVESRAVAFALEFRVAGDALNFMLVEVKGSCVGWPIRCRQQYGDHNVPKYSANRGLSEGSSRRLNPLDLLDSAEGSS